MPKLICCLIGDNCADTIRMSLDSVINDVDKIVFVWGMEDINTRNILREYEQNYPEKMVIIESKYNQEDRAQNGKQRNIYLSYLKQHHINDYAIVLDPDEVIDDISKFKKELERISNCEDLKDKLVFYHFKMVHFIYNLAHEDSVSNEHFCLARGFKITDELLYPEVEHPVLNIVSVIDGLTKEKEHYNRITFSFIKDPIIWHLGYIKNIIDVRRKYKNHLKKSNIHSPEFLRRWYVSHLFGDYPTRKFDTSKLPQILLKYFDIEDIEEVKYFEHRRHLEHQHFVSCLQFKNFFVPTKALDIGCAIGHKTYLLNEYGINTKGFDISEYAIGSSPYKEILGNKLYVDNILDLKKKDEKYDFVLCYDVMEHIREEDIEKALSNIKLLATKNVLFSICFYNDPNFEIDGTHITKKSREWWENKVKQAGFEIGNLPSDMMFRNQLIWGYKK